MNSLQLSLTKLYLRYRRAQFQSIRFVQLPDGQVIEAIAYSSKNEFVIGQVTLVGTTIIHELVFESPPLLEYVAIHETAHKKQWYRHLMWPLAVVCVIASSMMLLAVVFGILLSILLREPMLLASSFVALLFAAMILLPPCLFSWILEYKADCQSVKILGAQSVLGIFDSLPRPIAKPNLAWRILGRLTHPPITLTVKVCRFFNRDIK